jgi:hypothetical protein
MSSPEPVEPQDASLANTPVVDAPESPVAPENTSPPITRAKCTWNGKEYSEGATVCSSHKEYQCQTNWDGTEYVTSWVKVGKC